ncbi:hypothetical protein LZK98_15590 [Sphingomonas cannabina]|uniref:hypothetical protein n=1 Tax=Sphingomonas cannabina TaxID=2899123 RepID=UPI001F1B3DA4|nr:hypothetical protein [Sphingomonas cannabina]UIJ44472.1 hypothetical protein LZK98_15590 [Sphingomonas cannabina]
MTRPLNRNQVMQNRAFLRVLRRTGNARAAAEQLGLNRSMLTKRRARHPAFAAQWDAALAIAHARLHGRVADAGEGEPRPVRTASGRVQLRRAQKGSLTRTARQTFLAALSVTANIRLAAAAAGFSHAAFYDLRRRDPGFAREMRLALQEGYEQVEAALLAGFAVEAHEHDDWRHNDRPAMPRMTPDQALQLLHLHQKEARLAEVPPEARRRRGESGDAYSMRLALMHEARMARDREAFLIAEAARRARGGPSGWPGEVPVLPDLEQVTGWSKADPAKPPHEPRRALFGGWRITDWDGDEDDG